MKSDDIFGFLSQFGVYWSTHWPDLCFIQVVAVLPGYCGGRDPFYMENDEILIAIKQHLATEAAAKKLFGACGVNTFNSIADDKKDKDGKNSIYSFLSRLGIFWSAHYPSLRFGQLISLLSKFYEQSPLYPYMTNDEVLFAVEEHFSKEK